MLNFFLLLVVYRCSLPSELASEIASETSSSHDQTPVPAGCHCQSPLIRLHRHSRTRLFLEFGSLVKSTVCAVDSCLCSESCSTACFKRAFQQFAKTDVFDVKVLIFFDHDVVRELERNSVKRTPSGSFELIRIETSEVVSSSGESAGWPISVYLLQPWSIVRMTRAQTPPPSFPLILRENPHAGLSTVLEGDPDDFHLQ